MSSNPFEPAQTCSRPPTFALGLARLAVLLVACSGLCLACGDLRPLLNGEKENLPPPRQTQPPGTADGSVIPGRGGTEVSLTDGAAERLRAAGFTLAETESLAARLTFVDPPAVSRFLKARLEVVAGPSHPQLTPGATPLDATVARLQPWMAIHGHGTSERKLKVIASSEQPGQFEIQGLFFVMAGPWELRFWLDAPGLPTTLVTIPVVIP